MRDVRIGFPEPCKRRSYCSAACKQRAHRSRNRNRNARAVTVTAIARAAHSAEARAVLAGLDAELVDNAELLGVSLEWSAARSGHFVS